MGSGLYRNRTRSRPARSNDRSQSPPVLINGLRVAGVEQTIADFGETNLSGFTLEQDQNQLQIDFFGLSFAPGGLLRYQYKLEGADTDWSQLTEQRSITSPTATEERSRFGKPPI